MTGATNDSPRLRLSIVAVVAVALFASLFARLYDLQVVGSREFQVQAEANRVREVLIPAPRGRILDRNGKVLVDNRVAAVVAIDRHAFSELSERGQDAVLLRLTAELGRAGIATDPGQLRDRLGDERIDRYAPVPVAIGVPEELKIYIEEHPDRFPAVEVERTAVRAYPYGDLAAHTLGFIGQIDQDELDAAADETAKPYSLNDVIGKSGVEKTYEEHLRGTPGVRRVEVDATGEPVRVINEQPPRPGDDIVLSIDADIQALAEHKLVQGLQEARGRTRSGEPPNRATKGAAVVLDPNNGQVIALASYPAYDPTTLADGIDAAEWETLNDPATGERLNNWAIKGQWAPGSSYKLFVAYAALRAGVMAPDTVFHDTGGYLIPGCRGSKCFRSNAGGQAYGNVTLSRAITISSDAYFYNVGAQFWLQRERFGGPEGMQKHLSAFGLGKRTGIALTGEEEGRVPTPEWKREFNEQFEDGDPVWRSGDNVNMAIGQGDVLVTPLQLTNGYATFANGGTRYRPQMALRAQAYGTDEVTKKFTPTVEDEVDLPGHVRQPIYDGLVNVPVSGTATSAFSGFPLDTYPIAGKTGTAEVDDKADTAVFAAFGPAPAPKYAVAAILDESGFGGTAAAPVVRAIFDVLSGTVEKPEVQPGGTLDLPQDELSQVSGSFD